MLHQSVLKKETLDSLNINKNGIYLDATFGRGGHSQVILNQLGTAGQLIVVDRDPEAIEYANTLFAQDKRVTILYSDFASIQEFIVQHQLIGRINGILFDLGVSSPQFDQPERGFSLKYDGPLDMRMDPKHGLSAAEWINSATEQEIIDVLQQYGEEKHAKLLARCIVSDRKQVPFSTSLQLAKLVERVIGKFKKQNSKIHPATKVFQAIRIVVNDELKQLEKVMPLAVNWLAPQGRLAIISFHSLEDRMVKQFMRRLSTDNTPAYIPLTNNQLNRKLKIIHRVIKPSSEEIKTNSRARSARLRVAEKL